MRVLAALGLPAVVAFAIYAGAVDKSNCEILGIGLLTAVASFSVGALLGFLFGIPRSAAAKAKAGTEKPEAEKSADEKTAEAAHRFLPNTNLEEISDWLTKILVGVGLVQIHQVSGAVDTLASGLEADLGGGSQGYAVAVTLLVAFSITGFVSAYLYTRLRLQSAFELAAEIKRAIQERADTETGAIALIQQQLAPGTESPTPQALTDALKAATSGVRAQAFFLARKQRLEDLGAEATAEERREFAGLSIPVFEALITCDPGEKYPRLRAELGYALLKHEPPRLAEARAAFDKAIALRPTELASRTPLYEFNRAYCTIELDPSWQARGVSLDSVIDAVCADLEVAVTSLGSVDRDRRAVVTEWLEKNSALAGNPSHERARALLARFSQLTSV